MKLNRYIAIAAAVLALGSCAKWTDQEPVEVLYPTLKDKNPELYAKYMESVRDYRASEHQVLIAKFDNKPGVPAGRADHIECLPDSVDFVILNNPLEVSASIVEEMASIKEGKAVKTLMDLSYDAIVKDWEALLAEEAAEKEAEWEALSDEEKEARKEAYDNDPRGVDDQSRFLTFVQEQLSAFFSAVGPCGFDGVNAQFTGCNPASLNDEQKAALQERYDAFFNPVTAWAEGKVLFFEGNPKNVLSASGILDKALYIILPCENELTVSGFNYALNQVLGKGVPTGKFVIGVTALDVTDETATAGLFTGESSAIVGAARWAVTPDSRVTKKGICVNHAQFDYYNIQHVYSQIGAAISIMNPSPVK